MYQLHSAASVRDLETFGGGRITASYLIKANGTISEDRYPHCGVRFEAAGVVDVAC